MGAVGAAEWGGYTVKSSDALHYHISLDKSGIDPDQRTWTGPKAKGVDTDVIM